MLQGYLVKSTFVCLLWLALYLFRYQKRVALYIAAFYGYIESLNGPWKQVCGPMRQSACTPTEHGARKPHHRRL